VRCAEARRTELAAVGVRIRAGLHAGEVDVAGTTSAGWRAHRVPSDERRPAGEILVSRTIRDLATGSDLTFSDRGENGAQGGRPLAAPRSWLPLPTWRRCGPLSRSGPHTSLGLRFGIWAGVGVLSFLGGSAVLGVALPLHNEGATMWWLAAVVGTVPVVVLLFVIGDSFEDVAPGDRGDRPRSSLRR
jgi:hypothetical protein